MSRCGSSSTDLDSPLLRAPGRAAVPTPTHRAAGRTARTSPLALATPHTHLRVLHRIAAPSRCRRTGRDTLSRRKVITAAAIPVRWRACFGDRRVSAGIRRSEKLRGRAQLQALLGSATRPRPHPRRPRRRRRRRYRRRCRYHRLVDATAINAG